MNYGSNVFTETNVENVDYWAHFQSNSNWTLILALKPDPNPYTNPNPNPIHPTDPTNPNRYSMSI